MFSQRPNQCLPDMLEGRPSELKRRSPIIESCSNRCRDHSKGKEKQDEKHECPQSLCSPSVTLEGCANGSTFGALTRPRREEQRTASSLRYVQEHWTF